MNDAIYVAGWVLVHFVWQGTVVAFAAALALRACRQQSASTRYLIACGAMIAMLLCVTMTAALVDAPVATVESTPASAFATADGKADVLLPIHVSSSEAASPLAADRLEPLLPWIVSAWLAGVLLLLARVVAGWWRVRRLHQHALSSMRSSWQHAADRIAGRLGLARVVRIVELSGVDVPLVVGCLRPIVVLPIAALSSLSAAQVEAILAHELAHVRRHDYLINLMQTLAETLLFYHPAVWWLSARIRDEREHCCDDVAIAVCGDAAGYAAALTELEAWRTGELSLAAAATGGSLLNRIRRILRVEISDDSRRSPWTIVMVVLGVVIGLTLHPVAQTSQPSEARPSFEVASVKPNKAAPRGSSWMAQPGGRFIATNMTVAMLIRNAFDLQESQLAAVPDWVSSERFDIVAKAEQEFPRTNTKPSVVQLMVQSLLEERFQLRSHRETRDLPAYALVLARADGRFGPQLEKSDVDCAALLAAQRAAGATPQGGGGQRGSTSTASTPPTPGPRRPCTMTMAGGTLRAGSVQMANLAMTLSSVVQRIVVDRTGLTGGFDFDLTFTTDSTADATSPSVFTAVQEQLGLKLDSVRVPMDVLVIDSVQRPTPD